MSVFSAEVYQELRQRRYEAIINHYGKDWFNGKKILEVGCGEGDLVAMFIGLGAELHGAEIREEHISNGSKKYPFISFHKTNFEQELILSNFDLIINCGTLYHLCKFKSFLINTLKISKHVFLETIVCDSSNPYFFTFVKEQGEDQAYEGLGSRPSPSNIERIIKETKCEFTRFFDSSLNCQQNVFDWEHQDTELDHIQEPFRFLRRAWFIENPNK